MLILTYHYIVGLNRVGTFNLSLDRSVDLFGKLLYEYFLVTFVCWDFADEESEHKLVNFFHGLQNFLEESRRKKTYK